MSAQARSQDLADHVRALRGDAERLAGTAQNAADEVARLAGSQTREHPYAVVGGAFALGFVLARGVPPAVLGLVSAVAARVAVTTVAGTISRGLTGGGEGETMQKEEES